MGEPSAVDSVTAESAAAKEEVALAEKGSAAEVVMAPAKEEVALAAEEMDLAASGKETQEAVRGDTWVAVLAVARVVEREATKMGAAAREVAWEVVARAGVL